MSDITISTWDTSTEYYSGGRFFLCKTTFIYLFMYINIFVLITVLYVKIKLNVFKTRLHHEKGSFQYHSFQT